MRKTQRPDVGAVGPKLETLSGVKPDFSSKIAELIKLNGGFVTPASGASRGVP